MVFQVKTVLTPLRPPQAVIKLLKFFDRAIFFKRAMALLILTLLCWSIFLKYTFAHSNEATISSARLAAELAFVCLIFYIPRINLADAFRTFVIGLAVLNSVVVIIQLFEAAGCLATPFHTIITDFWGMALEWTRKTGIFNGYLTSSLVSFMAMVMLSKRRDWLSIGLMSLCAIPIIFGSRTFVIFLPLFFIINPRALAGTALLLLGMFLVGSFCGMPGLFKNHYDERIKPTIAVVATVNPEKDYSSHDLMTHYKEPQTVNEWITGNGQPRFSEVGGKDPAFSRWLLQSGLLASVLVILISALVCYRIARKGGAANVLLALSLILATFKSELITSTLVFSLLVIYALAINPLPAHKPETCT